MTAHGEGILLHRTLRSARRAIIKLDDQGISWELLIHIDNATPATQAYIAANQDFLADYPIFYNAFKDLSASRNFMVGQSSGRFITFVDADDLVSDTWWADGVRYLRDNDGPLVLHTEYLINFGRQNLVWRKFDAKSLEADALNMVWANRWDSAVMAPRQVFESHPYAPNTHGFGSEDWHFGSQTLAAHIPHRVVPGTILFARRRDVSEMSIQQSDFRTVHYTDLLDIDFVRSINLAQVADLPQADRENPAAVTAGRLQRLQNLSVKGAAKAYRVMSALPALEPYLTAGKDRLKHNRRSTAARFPRWLTDEWRAMHAIDKQVFPDDELLQNVPVYISEMYELGIAYRNLLQHVSAYPDYIFVIPHLIPGGADLVILNYVQALRTLHPDWHILVIATNDTPSPWAARLPKEVDYLPFGQVCHESGVWDDLHLQLFARLIVQLKCKRLHIIQSALGFTFAQKYRQLLTGNGYTVYGCAFCEDVDDQGRFIGHIHSGLPKAFPSLTAVFTDNQAVADQLAYEYGLDYDRFVTHYQPAEITDMRQPAVRTAGTQLRILWASRVTTQKRPDILRRIAEQLDPASFHIDAYGSLHDGFTAEYFAGTAALSYKGGFNGLDSISTANYDLFLYTSANDGVPNILLGVAALGLPIVASDAGGVSEFVQDGVTGSLITDREDIAAYVSTLDRLRQDPHTAHRQAVAAQELLHTRHSQQAFLNRVMEDIS